MYIGMVVWSGHNWRFVGKFTKKRWRVMVLPHHQSRSYCRNAHRSSFNP